MKTFPIIVLLIFTATHLPAQHSKGFDPSYRFLSSGNIVQDKNFYFLTLLESDTTLFRSLSLAPVQVMSDACLNDNNCYFAGLAWTDNRNSAAIKTLTDAYFRDDRLKKMIIRHMRPSGYFEKYQHVNDTGLLRAAWLDAASGINGIINSYALGKGLRYAKIDSASYEVASKYYQGLLQEMIHQYELLHTGHAMPFFKRSLDIAMQLLAFNNRDEAARLEPLSQTNANAYRNVPKIKWPDHPYSSILVLGEGPEFEGLTISPYGKLRCNLAAELYRQHKAPFIIVSGGFVHPFQTKYAEAVGMKNYLVTACGVPEDRIMIDPQARHTTTNLRNANRIILRSGMPVNKPVLCVSSRSHVDYIFNGRFETRSLSEIGHVPYKQLNRIDPYQFSFYPAKESLQMDASDPLDP